MNLDESIIRRLVEQDGMSYRQVKEKLEANDGTEQRGYSERTIRRFCQENGIRRRSQAMDENSLKQQIQENGWSNSQVFDYLSEEVGKYGSSERNIRRFCKEHGLYRRAVYSNEKLDYIVEDAVRQLGPAYGHRMLIGHLEVKGVSGISRRRILDSMRRVDAANVAARGIMARKRQNPKRYHAPYFGYNLHIDQNEKLKDYGVTYVTGIDGYSSYVFDVSVMPVKNNLTIYGEFFKHIVEEFGLFDRVLADGGTEFNLALFMQSYYWSMVDPERNPLATYRQMPSTLNNRIERYWRENNERVTYDIKRALIELEQRGLADPTIPRHLSSISQMAMIIARHGSKQTADAWNNHLIEDCVHYSNLASECSVEFRLHLLEWSKFEMEHVDEYR